MQRNKLKEISVYHGCMVLPVYPLENNWHIKASGKAVRQEQSQKTCKDQHNLDLIWFMRPSNSIATLGGALYFRNNWSFLPEFNRAHQGHGGYWSNNSYLLCHPGHRTEAFRQGFAMQMGKATIPHGTCGPNFLNRVSHLVTCGATPLKPISTNCSYAITWLSELSYWYAWYSEGETQPIETRNSVIRAKLAVWSTIKSWIRDGKIYHRLACRSVAAAKNLGL